MIYNGFHALLVFCVNFNLNFPMYFFLILKFLGCPRPEIHSTRLKIKIEKLLRPIFESI